MAPIDNNPYLNGLAFTKMVPIFKGDIKIEHFLQPFER